MQMKWLLRLLVYLAPTERRRKNVYFESAERICKHDT